MYRKIFIDLYENFDFEEAKSEVDFVLDVLFNYQYKDFILGKTLDSAQIEKVKKIIKERVLTHKPIQQIVSQAYFYSRKFFVNEYTLIPRPETELLVEKAIECSQKFENPKILDIGTGSGCIPITLALENKQLKADSVDISIEAIEIAKKNALIHNVYDSVNFFKSDLFENVNQKYNIIVSNPPYIPISEKENLQIEVKDFEPSSALFAYDKLGIEFYKKITEQAYNYLSDGGYLLFEIGINQANEIKNLLELNNFKEIEIFKDLNSIDRVTICKK